jgi:branched-chain amino acid transport system substrate-binding protein
MGPAEPPWRLRHTRTALAVVVTLLVALTLAACGSDSDSGGDANTTAGGTSTSSAGSSTDPAPASKASGEPITIGIVEDRSGPAAAYSQLEVDMAKLVAAQMNAGNFLYAADAVSDRAGIGGRPVELIYEDDQGNPNLTVLRTQKLVDRGADAIILTTQSAATLQGRVVCEKAKIPCISPANSNSTITEAPNNDYIFTVAPPITMLSEGLTEAFKAQGYRKVAFHLADDPSQQALTDLWADGFERAGMEIVAREVLPVGATDNTSQLLRLQKADPDVIMEMSAPPAAITQFYQSRERVGLDTPVWSSNALTAQPATWELAGSALDGALVMDSYDPSNPNTQEAADLYHAAFPDKPFLNTLSQTTDTMLLFKAAFEAARGEDGTAVRDALANVRGFPAAYGREGYTLGFSPENHNGASPRALAIVEFEDAEPHLWDEFQPGS